MCVFVKIMDKRMKPKISNLINSCVHPPTQDLPSVRVKEKAETILAIVHENALGDFGFRGENHELPDNRVPRQAVWIHAPLMLPEAIGILYHLHNSSNKWEGEQGPFDRSSPRIKPTGGDHGIERMINHDRGMSLGWG